MTKTAAGRYSVILIALMLLFILGVNTGLKLHYMPKQFPSEPFAILGAIRLHYLPKLNLQADHIDNFFKSWFFTSHGWNDFLYFYMVTGVYETLKIPLSEVNFYYSLHLLAVFYLIVVFLIGKYAFDLTTGVVASVLLSVSYWSVHAANCLNHIMSTMFLEALLLLSVILYLRHKTLITQILFALMLCLAASIELVIFLPAVLFLEVLWKKHNQQSIKELIKFEHIRLWIPAFFSALVTFMVFALFKKSNLGMWSYQTHVFPFKLTNIANLKQLFYYLHMRQEIWQEDYFGFAVIGSIIFFILFLKKIKWHHPIFGFILMFFIACLANIMTSRMKFYTADLTAGIIVAYAFTWLFNKWDKNAVGRLAIVVLLAVLIPAESSTQCKYQRQRKGQLGHGYYQPHPLKVAGYFIRKQGGPQSTVFNLFKNLVYFDQTEYYYGKYIGTDGEYPKQNFSLFYYTPEEAKQRYNIGEFDFYVSLQGERQFQALVERRLRKVADIYERYEPPRYVNLLASVYSPHPLAYQQMDLEKYDKYWNRDFANLNRLFPNWRTGLSSLTGNRE